MNYYIMTLFPEMFPGIMDASILGRGGEKGLIRWETFNIRDYTLDKHSKVDDYPYGGGAGMVMQAEQVVILHHRGKCLTSLWQKSLPGRRSWCSSVAIMRASMKEF